MQNILISIKPNYINLIFQNKKKVELRRRIGKNFTVGAKLYLYATSPEKAIVGQACISKIDSYDLKEMNPELISSICKMGCITLEAFSLYFKNSPKCYLLSLTNIIQYEKRISLHQMKNVMLRPPQSFMYINTKIDELLQHEMLQ
ncbi:ASCH domain-containing protein [Thorsellia anophelis]|uniref:Predicted transcriptional regulator, contains an HTH and PUA-like domains n=1 Tax=Thorsellia anophelis DSM 18579 TaxID=1123402 RepID=A0A1I0AT60_9GAMM|nr:ASCH domain-containing protein [Thorsellia anophelis]SES97525.1 Predicted transcriptional regulator, contains an HTH and PUA-like domains [Thorsellia anophelis DSM 18579]